ncbi:MAG: FixH family protein [Paracoccaceae bacterium]|nr:FixH family protein [Paracoccaceae bacterium]
MTKWRSCLLVVFGFGILPGIAIAGDRKHVEITCEPTNEKLVFDCTMMLTGRKSGVPIADAEFTVGADMPSMPGAHNIKPVPALPRDTPGLYEARIHLEMLGDWAVKLDFTKPDRDRVVEKIRFAE